eukprot:Hpha_TRINITY_DN30687_c0_g1::TRINITY_DN30687_c0_g1_i1::g.18245::m.18245
MTLFYRRQQVFVMRQLGDRAYPGGRDSTETNIGTTLCIAFCQYRSRHMHKLHHVGLPGIPGLLGLGRQFFVPTPLDVDLLGSLRHPGYREHHLCHWLSNARVDGRVNPRPTPWSSRCVLQQLETLNMSPLGGKCQGGLAILIFYVQCRPSILQYFQTLTMSTRGRMHQGSHSFPCTHVNIRPSAKHFVKALSVSKRGGMHQGGVSDLVPSSHTRTLANKVMHNIKVTVTDCTHQGGTPVVLLCVDICRLSLSSHFSHVPRTGGIIQLKLGGAPWCGVGDHPQGEHHRVQERGRLRGLPGNRGRGPLLSRHFIPTREKPENTKKNIYGFDSNKVQK